MYVWVWAAASGEAHLHPFTSLRPLLALPTHPRRRRRSAAHHDEHIAPKIGAHVTAEQRNHNRFNPLLGRYAEEAAEAQMRQREQNQRTAKAALIKSYQAAHPDALTTTDSLHNSPLRPPRRSRSAAGHYGQSRVPPFVGQASHETTEPHHHGRDFPLARETEQWWVMGGNDGGQDRAAVASTKADGEALRRSRMRPWDTGRNPLVDNPDLSRPGKKVDPSKGRSSAMGTSFWEVGSEIHPPPPREPERTTQVRVFPSPAVDGLGAASPADHAERKHFESHNGATATPVDLAHIGANDVVRPDGKMLGEQRLKSHTRYNIITLADPPEVRRAARPAPIRATILARRAGSGRSGVGGLGRISAARPGPGRWSRIGGGVGGGSSVGGGGGGGGGGGMGFVSGSQSLGADFNFLDRRGTV